MLDYLLPFEPADVPAQVRFISVLELNSSYKFMKISLTSQPVQKSPSVLPARRSSPLGLSKQPRARSLRSAGSCQQTGAQHHRHSEHSSGCFPITYYPFKLLFSQITHLQNFMGWGLKLSSNLAAFYPGILVLNHFAIDIFCLENHKKHGWTNLCFISRTGSVQSWSLPKDVQLLVQLQQLWGQECVFPTQKKPNNCLFIKWK